MEIRTNPQDQYIELGKVAWLRDYDEALKQSRTNNKPVLLFFQEVPGCSTCVNYGRAALSHPLMVEFIESFFVPLAIHNNKPGKDAQVLSLYNEPSWNNPVTHFVDHEGQDIIPKLADEYHPLGLYYKLLEVLETTNTAVPEYVKLLEDDLKLQCGFFKCTIYETPCFWSGETTLSLHPAVKYTEAGWIDGLEVVKVFFDDTKASLSELNTYATREGFFTIENHHKYKIDKEPQYYLSKTPFAHLPLSKIQRVKINTALPYNKQPEKYLSPKQLDAYMKISKEIKNQKNN